MAKTAAAAVKKPENIQFQIEVENEIQWRSLLRREGLVVIDVYASWAGPCTSMISILKRVKVEVNEDRLWYGMACSDNIDDLLMFKDQSQPTWLFVGGGKPIRVIRGSNAPILINAIKSELEHELQCIEGKSRRNFISIDDEVSRKKKAEAEAGRLAKMVVEEDDAAAETLNDLRRDSSVSLMGSLEPYTIAVIQPFVVEAGSAQEIKDFLMGDFKIVHEVIVNVTEEVARNLYRIPFEITDPVQDFGYVPPVDGEFGAGDDDGANSSAFDADDEDAPKPKQQMKPSKPKKKMIQIPLPEGLLGETIVLLLENEEIKTLADKKEKPVGTLLQTADDYIRVKVGPVVYTDALEHAPSSLHAVYGKGENAPGVWCPRKYDDKRFVMLNFFPQFIQTVLAYTPMEPRKYLLVILPASGSEAMAENADVSNNTKDIVAQGRMKIPMEIVDEMLKSSNVPDGELMARKAPLITGDVYVVSINRKNDALKAALNTMNPLHISFDDACGRKETAQMFPKLNLPITEDQSPEEILERFMARSRPRIGQLISIQDLDDLPMNPISSYDEDEYEDNMAADEDIHLSTEGPPSLQVSGDDEEEEEEEEDR